MVPVLRSTLRRRCCKKDSPPTALSQGGLMKAAQPPAKRSEIETTPNRVIELSLVNGQNAPSKFGVPRLMLQRGWRSLLERRHPMNWQFTAKGRDSIAQDVSACVGEGYCILRGCRSRTRRPSRRPVLPAHDEQARSALTRRCRAMA